MVVVAQLGARMHYAVPSILEREGMLERLYTDLYAPRLPRRVQNWASRFGPTPVRRWLGRVPGDIPGHKITAFPAIGLEYYYRRRSAKTRESVTAVDLWAGRQLCRRVIKRGLGSARIIYTYNSAGLELLQYAREHGRFAITEQTCAPSAIYEGILDDEQRRYPAWGALRPHDKYRESFDERERAEWMTADLILCASEFVRNGIEACGGPAEKCRVVPYGVSLPPVLRARSSSSRPLRILTVGAVGLRKGAPYVLETARMLKHRAEFRMAGQLDITPYAQNLLSEHVTLLGAVPRAEIHRQFGWADVFLLPTLCEGSATVCYEALAHGLPVVTTPNAGSVVRDGIDGFIVPIRDAAAIADRIEVLLDDGDLFSAMSNSAIARAAEYTVEKYGDRLLNAFQDIPDIANHDVCSRDRFLSHAR